MQKHLDQRTNLKFLVTQGRSPIDCFRQLQGVYGESVMSHSSVKHWHRCFMEGDGHTPVTDMLRSGRRVSKTGQDSVDLLEDMVQRDQRKTVRELSSQSGLAKTTVHCILKSKLNLKRTTAKFVPKVLTDAQKQSRMRMCQQNLDSYTKEKHFLAKWGRELGVCLRARIENQVFPVVAQRSQKATESSERKVNQEGDADSFF